MRLHSVEIDNSKSATHPVIFLHGFGGVADQWHGLQASLSFYAPTLAFDLPGHGKSLDYPNAGPPKVAAKAVLEEMAARNIEKAHIVGHSMGGAIASLLALFAPEKIASLTLLAPGGYGEEFNHPLLLKWGAAKTREELHSVMLAFFSADYQIPSKVYDFQTAIRNQPGAVESLSAIAKGMSSDGKQGMLPIDAVVATDCPITVIWGRNDEVLPVTQAEQLKGKVNLHILDGVGHSPAEEATKFVNEKIKAQLK
ncbi:MAG: alpha/beta fold hydrolase [Rhizobiaceae bacterium]